MILYENWIEKSAVGEERTLPETFMFKILNIKVPRGPKYQQSLASKEPTIFILLCCLSCYLCIQLLVSAGLPGVEVGVVFLYLTSVSYENKD